MLHGAAGLAIVVSVLLAGCSRPAQGPTSLVLIVVDTLRADHLGAYGYWRNTSPHLDRLAGEGVLFENARSQASCTFPSVNSLLTSRYPKSLLRMVPERAEGELGIPEGVVTVAQVLQGSGYATAAFSASPVVRATPGEVNHQGGFGRGFDGFDESCEWRQAACLNDRLSDWLLTHPQRPVFLYLHYMDPHDPYQPGGEARGQFTRNRVVHEPWVLHGDPNPIAEMLYDDGPAVPTGAPQLDYLRALYDEEILYWDDELARLEGLLSRAGIWRNALVVIAADHGESFLGDGDVKHCRNVYDQEIHTPLVLWASETLGWPGFAGRRLAAPVANLDVVPTALDYLGVAVPQAGWHGRSLRPRIEAGDAAAGAEPPPVFSTMERWRAATGSRFKLIRDIAHGDDRLFDLAADPDERHDVLRRHPRVYRRLRHALNGHLEEIEQGEPESGDELERLRALGYLQ